MTMQLIVFPRPAMGPLINSRRQAALTVRIGLLSENHLGTGFAGRPVARTHADLSRSHSRFGLRTSARGGPLFACRDPHGRQNCNRAYISAVMISS
jgi:hypothetical protein